MSTPGNPRWLTNASGEPEYSMDLPDYLLDYSKLRPDIDAWARENMTPGETWVTVYSYATDSAQLYSTVENDLVFFKMRWFNTEREDVG